MGYTFLGVNETESDIRKMVVAFTYVFESINQSLTPLTN